MDLVLFGFVGIVGFVASACLYYADGLVRGAPVSFALQTTRPLEVLSTLVFCMFAGPYMVASQGGKLWWQRQIPDVIFGFGIIITVLWSFCAGVFVAQLLSLAGVIIA